MGKSKFALFFFALALFTLPAFAWDCTVPGQIRVQVPAGSVGSGTGDGSGQVVTVQGITFQCQAPPTAPPSSSPTTSSSSSTSSSNSGASATGGNSTATGGKSTSTSGVNNSGNSTNTNNNNLSNNLALNNTNNLTNTQGQKQGQTQSNSSTNSNQSAGGSVSDVGNSETTVEAPKIPVNTAEAPPVFSTANCFKGFSAGGQTAVAGLSFGGGGIDKNCAAERIAQDYYAMGNRLAACKVIITTKASKDAHVTLADCLNVPERPRVILQPAPQVPSAPPVSVTVNLPPQPPAQVLPIFHEYVTVTATPAQVRAARSPAHKPAPVHKAHKPCPVTPLQNDCPVKTAEK